MNRREFLKGTAWMATLAAFSGCCADRLGFGADGSMYGFAEKPKKRVRVGILGGQDFIMDLRWAYCLQNGIPLDLDVYDAAASSCLCELTERSVRNRSRAEDIPDFTRGAWRTKCERIGRISRKGADTSRGRALGRWLKRSGCVRGWSWDDWMQWRSGFVLQLANLRPKWSRQDHAPSTPRSLLSSRIR